MLLKRLWPSMLAATPPPLVALLSDALPIALPAPRRDAPSPSPPRPPSDDFVDALAPHLSPDADLGAGGEVGATEAEALRRAATAEANARASEAAHRVAATEAAESEKFAHASKVSAENEGRERAVAIGHADQRARDAERVAADAAARRTRWRGEARERWRPRSDSIRGRGYRLC